MMVGSGLAVVNSSVFVFILEGAMTLKLVRLSRAVAVGYSSPTRRYGRGRDTSAYGRKGPVSGTNGDGDGADEMLWVVRTRTKGVAYQSDTCYRRDRPRQRTIRCCSKVENRMQKEVFRRMIQMGEW
jgi:hypothetical protein